MMRWTVPVLLLLFCMGPIQIHASDWNRFKTDFISPDGRIIDYYQNESSHSEGQGYGLLLSVQNNDRQTFDLIWKWTRENLQVRKADTLLAWHWGKHANGNWTVLDYNNASDGDLLVALALLKAAEMWPDGNYDHPAKSIIAGIRTGLFVTRGDRLCLLPGQSGFAKPEGLVLNPSYFVFSALSRFGRVENADFWKKARSDSLYLLKESLRTRFQLPPDWIVFDGQKASPQEGKGDRFGYEAIRTLLYLSWDHNAQALPELKSYFELSRRLGYLPEWMDLTRNAVSMNEASAGFLAVAARAAAEIGDRESADRLKKSADEKIKTEKRVYYSHVLYLLSGVNLEP